MPMYTNNMPTTNTVPEPIEIILNNDGGKYFSRNAIVVNTAKLIPTIIK